MPRHARIMPPSGFFHVITRGNNKQDVFLRPADFQTYKWILWNVGKEHVYHLLHYCLMRNHVHMLIKTVEGHPLSKIMHKINLRYASYYKKKYGHCGHFWQDRFKSLLIGEDSYLLECGAYIELNPYKAGLVRNVEDYEYTSYRHYAQGELDPLVKQNPLYGGFGKNIKEQRMQYRAFVEGRVDRWGSYQKLLESRAVLGEGEFLSGVSKKLRVATSRRKRGRPRKGAFKNRTVPNF